MKMNREKKNQGELPQTLQRVNRFFMNSLSLSQLEENLPFSHICELSNSQFIHNSTIKKSILRKTCKQQEPEEQTGRPMLKTFNPDQSPSNKIQGEESSKKFNAPLFVTEGNKIVISKFLDPDENNQNFFKSKFSKDKKEEEENAEIRKQFEDSDSENEDIKKKFQSSDPQEKEEAFVSTKEQVLRTKANLGSDNFLQTKQQVLKTKFQLGQDKFVPINEQILRTKMELGEEAKKTKNEKGNEELKKVEERKPCDEESDVSVDEVRKNILTLTNVQTNQFIKCPQLVLKTKKLSLP